MLTAFGIVFRLVFSRLAKMAAFTIEHWRVFLPLAIVCLGLWKINSLANERDAARDDLAEYQAQVAEATRKRQIENAIIETRLKTQQAEAIAKHQAELEQLRRNYNEANRDKTAAVNTASDLRRQLRDALATATTTGLPGDLRRPIRLTESGGNCDPADTGYDAEGYLGALEHACAITTSDYNTLWTRCAAVNEAR